MSHAYLIDFVTIPSSLLGRKWSAHVVDVTHSEGLLDMISLGCLIELSRPLDERLYTGESIPQDEQDEINAVQTRYRRFITWYQERFFIVIDGELINPSYLFRRRLVDFASTVVSYVREQENDFHKAPVGRHTLKEPAITRHILNHFSEGWADLSDTFLEVRKNASPRLYYDGPKIKIMARKRDWRQQFAALLFVEKDEWSLAPLSVSALQALRAAPPSGAPSGKILSSGETSSSGEDDMDVDDDEDDDDDEDSDDESGNEDEAEEESDDVISISSDSDDEESSSMQDDTPAAPAMAPGRSTPPPLKRSRSSPASSPKTSPSSSHPAKRRR